MNVILLHSDHRHVLATHVAIFREVSARIQIYLHCVKMEHMKQFLTLQLLLFY